VDNSPDWDYSIFQTVQCKYYPEVLFNWPPPGTIHQIKADNTPLCAIVKNTYTSSVSNSVNAVSDSVLLKAEVAHNECIALSLRYFNEKKYYEAIEQCKRALQFKPNSAVAYNNMCAAYNCLGKWEEAKRACEKALTLQPDFTLAKNNLNFTLQHLQQ
jgi:Tfp pilus assembly protein PilF